MAPRRRNPYEFLYVLCTLYHEVHFWKVYWLYSGPGNSVSIAPDYGLEGPGSNPGGDEIFRPSRYLSSFRKYVEKIKVTLTIGMNKE